MRSSVDILVLGPNAFNGLLEIYAFQISLQPDWQIDDLSFLTGRSWRILKSWYTGGGTEQGFWCCFGDQNCSSVGGVG